MSTKAKTETDLIEAAGVGSAGGLRSEPRGRAERPAGGAPLPGVELLLHEVRDRLSDEVIDELLAGARTEEEIVGPGGVLARLTKRLGAGAVGGADRASRLRAASGAARRHRQHG